MRFKYFIILSNILMSCNSKKKHLTSDCIVKISNELKNNIKKIIDASPYGFGSVIIHFSINQSIQDSLIIFPVVTDLQKKVKC